ncbi:MAG: hypothetical protein H0V66_09700 [Bdellovibrionales bacterium]|nr:hypothetical protein [Bdellovibrionales bacterium]
MPKKDSKEGFTRVVIASTNDVHGHYQAHQLEFKDRHTEGKQNIRVGGIDFISNYFKILRGHYGQVLMLDSGDIFSNKAHEMTFVSDFYSILDYDAITVGLKDFNLKLPAKYPSSADFLRDFATKSKTPLILSNLYELKTARVVEWPGTLPYLIREVNGVKIGILGLIPDDIVEQTPIDNRIGLYVESMLQSTLKHSRLLRSLGAEIIVVLTHQGLNCGDEIAQEMKLPLTKVNFEPGRKDVCDLSSKMGDFLNRLPHGLVDVIIGGRNHQKSANIIDSTLVMSGFDNGMSFSYAELYIDKKSKKLNKDLTVVHQPVMFCQEFFKETNDCYTEDSSVDHKVRIPATFLGQKIESDASLLQKFHYYLNGKSKTTSNVPKNIQSIIDFYEGDISYTNAGNNESKLLILNLKGSEISQILEDDYNQGMETNWKPSPFKLSQNSLALTLHGSAIEADKDYKILTSLEEAQKHLGLKKFISRASSKTLNSVSWNEPAMNKDDVTTTLSASDTVR